ncbi:CRISPR-associated protein Cas4 [Sulfolobus tengchongensis]|uniref:CRISPR-associated exonuclease Cas4 n=1 Tax=Sulfolobus tengchongensis TaxID=207809 RepID=A0AAX4L0P2_9CREN
MITEFILKRKLEDYLSHVRDENTIYVTDLVRCPRKIKYENQYKELSITQVYEPSAILGDLLHIGLETLLKNNFNADAEVEAERNIQVLGKTYKIKGKADVLIKNENDKKIVIEIKSSRSDKGLPHIHHKIQLQIYLWLFSAEKGILVYITPDRITEYEVNDPLDEATIIRYAEDIITLRNAPKFNWECKYCVFSAICPSKLS